MGTPEVASCEFLVAGCSLLVADSLQLRADFNARAHGVEVRAGESAGGFGRLDRIDRQHAEELPVGAVDDLELHALGHAVVAADGNHRVRNAGDVAAGADHAVYRRGGRARPPGGPPWGGSP